MSKSKKVKHPKPLKKSKSRIIIYSAVVLMVCFGVYVISVKRSDNKQEDVISSLSIAQKDIEVINANIDGNSKKNIDKTCYNLSRKIEKEPLYCEIKLTISGLNNIKSAMAIDSTVNSLGKWEIGESRYRSDNTLQSREYTHILTGLKCKSYTENKTSVYFYEFKCGSESRDIVYPYRD